MTKKLPKDYDKSTEEKIKIAAEKLFMERGFSGTRTRDIADEAGINLALLNYYYRSKENLFNIIIMEKMKVFFDILIDELNNNELTLQERVSSMVCKFTDLLVKEPNLSWFLLSEIQKNPDFFVTKLNIKERLSNTVIMQYPTSEDTQKNSIQFILSFLGMTFFPFIVRDVYEKLYNLSHEDYSQILKERCEFIPKLFEDFLPRFFQA